MAGNKVSIQARLIGRRLRQGRPAFRPLLWAVFWAVFWAALTYVSFAAIRIGQMRPQPDAIASSVPGFLSRLVLRPMEWLLNGVHHFDASSAVLQVAVVVTIFAVASRMPLGLDWSRGGDRA